MSDCGCTVCPNRECDEIPTMCEAVCTCGTRTDPADYCWGECGKPCRIERTSLGNSVICAECGDNCECVVCAV